MNTRLSISYVVIAYRNHTTLKRCLASIEHNCASGDELILVLNNPDQETKLLGQTATRWKILYESQQGPAHARNCGAQAAQNEILCFLDADVCIPSNWATDMLKNFANPWLAAGMSKIIPEKKDGHYFWQKTYFLRRFLAYKFESRFYFKANQSEASYLPTLDTACMMIKKTWLEKIGGFDPQFFRLEDSEISLRLLYWGGDLFYDNRTQAMEIYSASDTWFSILRNRFRSGLIIPLFMKKFTMDFKFSLAQDKKHPKIYRGLSFLLDLITFIGVSQSSELIIMAHRSVLMPKLNQKKISVGLDPESRFWRGAREFKLDVLGRKMIKLPAQ